MKSKISKLPEYYLIVIAILTGYTPPFHINPIFVGIVVLLLLQIIFRNKIAGLIIGVLFFVVNLLFLGALISEFNEFTAFTKEARKLLFVGLSIWTVNMMASLLMIFKYTKTDEMQTASLNYET